MFQYDDLIVQKSLRYLLIIQFVEVIPLGALAFLGHATLAFLLLFVTLIVGMGVLVLAYSRYQAHPLVVKKRSLIQRKIAIEGSIRAQHQTLSAAQQRRISLVQAEQAEATAALQAAQHAYIDQGLRNSRIADADIPGVGPKLKEHLAAAGVTSAADVSKASISSVEGFGEVKIGAVLNWRNDTQARLDGTKPGGLTAEKAGEIAAKYRTQHAANDEQEASAKARMLALENELAGHLPKLEPLAKITFANFLTTAMSADAARAGKMAGALLATTACLFALTGVGLVLPSSHGASTPPALDYNAIGTSAFETALASNVHTIQASSPTALALPTALASRTALESPTALSWPTQLNLPGVTAPSFAPGASAITGASCIPNHPAETARVVEIVDGDTIKVLLDRDGRTYPLRYIGMDTAEMNPPGLYMAAEAKARNAELAYGKTASLVKDVSEVDRYGRLLRYVIVDNVFINYELVAEGFARFASYPPDTACIPTFQSVEQQAATAQIGLWAAPPALIALPTASRSAGATACNCTGPDLDCKDFSTHASAQACYDSCMAAGYGDVFRLDGSDKDGKACETLP